MTIKNVDIQAIKETMLSYSLTPLESSKENGTLWNNIDALSKATDELEETCAGLSVEFYNEVTELHIRFEELDKSRLHIEEQTARKIDTLTTENKKLSKQVEILSKQLDKYEMRISNLEQSNCGAIAYTHERIDTLENKLKEMTSHTFTKRVEIIPIYDYEAIRNRNRALNRDLVRTYRIFSRLIDIRYNSPIAIAVAK